MAEAPTRPVSYTGRLVASTNLNLEEEVEEGRFREDLYYRIRVIEIHLPPLRERFEDVPLLVEPILSRLATRLNRRIRASNLKQ